MWTGKSAGLVVNVLSIAGIRVVATVDAHLRELDKLPNHDLNGVLLLDQHLGAELLVPGKDTQALINPQLMTI